MAHIIEVERHSEVEARSFLDALYYSDSVSAIGFHPKDKIFMLPVSEKLSHKVNRSISNKCLHCYLNRS